MNTVDSRTQSKILETLKDANTAITGIVAVMVQIQANLGMVSAALEQPVESITATPANIVSEVHDATQSSLDEMKVSVEKAAAAVNEVTEIIGKKINSQLTAEPDQPTEVDEPVLLTKAGEMPQLNQVDNNVLKFGNFAKQILSPKIVSGGRGFLHPDVYRDSLFFADDTANLKRIAKWQTGYYNAGNELMFHTTSFVVVYPRLNQHDSLDAVDPLIFFKRETADTLLSLHFIEVMDQPSLAILLDEVRNEYSKDDTAAI